MNPHDPAVWGKGWRDWPGQRTELLIKGQMEREVGGEGSSEGATSPGPSLGPSPPPFGCIWKCVTETTPFSWVNPLAGGCWVNPDRTMWSPGGIPDKIQANQLN
jgi:hypothetical protein